MIQPNEVTPIKIFKSAHDRSSNFISGGKGNKGRRDADDLRAAVVFAVSSVDAYFRSKIIHILRKKNQSSADRLLPNSVKKHIQKMISRDLFNNREYSQLRSKEKEAVDAMYNSKKPYLITYLQKSLEDLSFQNMDRLEEGVKMMGGRPQEIWGKINQSIIRDSQPQRTIGRPKKVKKGPKTNVKIQIRNLFLRRHRIVHDADLSIHGKRSRGQPISISYGIVKKWIDSTEILVNNVDSMIR